MPKQRLHEALAAVREALDAPDQLDAADRRTLLDTREQIETVLELSSEAGVDDHVQVRDQAARTIHQVGPRHGPVRAALGALLDTLTSLGL